jgi:hypothetical protein
LCRELPSLVLERQRRHPHPRVLGGYSLIRADDLATASSVAKGCPFVGAGGGVEVGLLMDLPRTPPTLDRAQG